MTRPAKRHTRNGFDSRSYGYRWRSAARPHSGWLPAAAARRGDGRPTSIKQETQMIEFAFISLRHIRRERGRPGALQSVDVLVTITYSVRRETFMNSVLCRVRGRSPVVKLFTYCFLDPRIDRFAI
ncbi:hypothetical protein EVAR_75380_1 [Eumeta japonica]|uniref:Uncharacterized protein n=1 Tax=Eumeta variegata TaxID=151549 RepID=A0A4C1YCI1_EUMVA|nr:hypothetical protein EVAR_75380_1 [Eumeta japonica]